MAVSPYDCSVEPKRAQVFCPEDTDIFNRYIHASVVRPGVVIENLEDLLAAELAGTALIARNISGTSDGGSPITGKGYGTQAESNQGSTVTDTLTELAVADNYDFWNALEASPQGWNYIKFLKGYMIKVPFEISLNFTDPITDAIASKAEFSIPIKYVVPAGKRPKPVPFDTDGLKTPQSLFDTSTIGFTADSSGNTATVVGDTVTVANSAALSVSLAAGTAVESVSVVGDTPLPAWLTLTRLVQGARLSGTAPVSDSTTELTIKFVNKNGISAQKNVKIVVA